MKTSDDWQQEAERLKNAAIREHTLMRHWQNRALTAEARLRMYDQREASR